MKKGTMKGTKNGKQYMEDSTDDWEKGIKKEDRIA
jgi:hypothetical protein